MGPQKFTAPNAAEALKLVRQKMGPDAMILSTNDIPDGVEIVAITSNDLTTMSGKTEIPDLSGHKTPDIKSYFRPNASRKANPFTKPTVSSQESGPTRYSEFYSDPAPSLRTPGTQSFRPARLEDSERVNIKKPPARPPQVNAPKSPNEVIKETVQPTQKQLINEGTLLNSAKVDKLFTEINEVKYLLQSQAANNLWNNLQSQNGQISEALKHLLNVGFSPKLCSQIVQNLPAGLQLPYLLKSASNQIYSLIKVLRPFDMFDKGGIYAFIGPTGVGKTTTITKIAARCVLRYGRNQVALLTTDTYRIGAQEQLKTFAKILGLSVTAIRDSEDLENKLKSLSNRKIILLDTAGVSQRDTLMIEQSQLLQQEKSKVTRILVMSSTTDLRTQEEVINLHNQAAFANNSGKLDATIITKIDEAAHLAPIIDSLIRNDLPVLFISNGQRVPEDLNLPDASYLSHRSVAIRSSSSDFSISNEQIPALLTDHLTDWMRKISS